MDPKSVTHLREGRGRRRLPDRWVTRVTSTHFFHITNEKIFAAIFRDGTTLGFLTSSDIFGSFPYFFEPTKNDIFCDVFYSNFVWKIQDFPFFMGFFCRKIPQKMGNFVYPDKIWKKKINNFCFEYQNVLWQMEFSHNLWDFGDLRNPIKYGKLLNFRRNFHRFEYFVIFIA